MFTSTTTTDSSAIEKDAGLNLKGLRNSLLLLVSGTVLSLALASPAMANDDVDEVEEATQDAAIILQQIIQPATIGGGVESQVPNTSAFCNSAAPTGGASATQCGINSDAQSAGSTAVGVSAVAIGSDTTALGRLARALSLIHI